MLINACSANVSVLVLNPTSFQPVKIDFVGGNTTPVTFFGITGMVTSLDTLHQYPSNGSTTSVSGTGDVNVCDMSFHIVDASQMLFRFSSLHESKLELSSTGTLKKFQPVFNSILFW